MYTGELGSSAEPFAALGMIPERAHQMPGCTAIVRPKEPARNRSTPEPAGVVFAARLQRPHPQYRPGNRPATGGLGLLVALRLGRKGRRFGLVPGCSSIPRLVQLGPKMTMIERGPHGVIPRVDQ